MLLKIIILLLLHECNAQLHVFEIDHIGNQISVEEFKKLDVCYSRICVRDAKKIIAKASHRNDSDPCVDFQEFACGHFNAYRPVSERNLEVSFESDYKGQLNDFMKKVLKERIEEDEPKIFKLVKNYYQKCVNSTYVRTEGKAEFKSILYEFGKFPIFEYNWKPSDFNLEKALIVGSRYLLTFSEEDNIININFGYRFHGRYETVRYVLKFEFNLSEKLTTEIYTDFFELFDSRIRSFDENYENYDYIPIQNFDEYYNISSGLDWLEVIKHHTNNNDINNDTLVKHSRAGRHALTYFDLKHRRKLANLYTIFFLYLKLDYFAVYPVPGITKRSKNRYEICIERLKSCVNFALEIMFQLKYGNETVSKPFKEFTEKYLSIQSSVGWKKEDYFKEFLPNPTIIVGFPDELTSPEFLNKLYADVTLTGDEGLYKMAQQFNYFSNYVFYKENNSIAIENLSENAKEIFKNCGKYNDESNHQDICLGLGKSIVFKVQNTLYPLFHPQRPYYVNLAYLSDPFASSQIRGVLPKFFSSEVDLQKHYSKYVEKFGPEQNTPGFLMTNEQMLEMIQYQSACFKTSYGYINSKEDISKTIFNCPLDE